jgi:CBS domain-containing protein
MARHDDPARRTADRLAYWVVTIAGVVLTALVVLTVFYAGDRADASKDVLNAVLPLLASWVGTVLAYYYSRENLNAATRSATEIARELSGSERLKEILVKDTMIGRDRIDTMTVAPETPLRDIIGFLKQRGRQRLPIFDENGAVRYIVHLSTINDCLGQAALDGKPVTDLTFADLLAEPARRKMLADSFAAVPETATLADAKAALEQGRGREDVFITRSGSRAEPVLGWITDNDLVRHARA